MISYYPDRKGKERKDENPIFNFEKISDFGYSQDGQNIVFSGVQKGQSDIFIFNVRSRTYEQVTKDIYDDLNPRFINNSHQLVFSSNRITDTLSTEKSNDVRTAPSFDIFMYDVDTKSKILKRITNTPWANEMQPFGYDSTSITYLSDESGIYNRYLAKMDSAISFIDTTEHYRFIVNSHALTNYARNINIQDVQSRTSKLAEIIYLDGKYRLYIEPFPEANTSKSLQETPYLKTIKTIAEKSSPDKPDTVSKSKNQIIKVFPEEKIPFDSTKIDINNYIFQNDVNKGKTAKKPEKDKKDLPKPTTPDAIVAHNDSIVPGLFKIRNYETAYSTRYIVTQADNTILNPTYQKFSGGGTIYYNPGVNGLFKIGTSDLLEDYRIIGGFRLSGDLSSNEYFLSYENLKKRWDKKISFYRQGRFFNTNDYSLRIHSHQVEYALKYPFSEITSFRATAGYRNDRMVYLASDQQNLRKDNIYENWGNIKGEYIFDNTIPTGLNLYNGTRFKIFGETFRQIDNRKTMMFVVGADFRTYIKVHREIIWANRFAASSSFGQKTLIYYLGAEDNWITPKFDYTITVDQSKPYAYEALATNLRGFSQNIRNGNSFALINSELRIPVFQYILNRPIKSDFIRNFQIVGFTDVGTAWTGKSPYDSTNSLNSIQVTRGPITVILNSQREPVVAGFGAGLRSRIFGYFIRFDYARGYEDGIVRPPVYYISLSLDF